MTRVAILTDLHYNKSAPEQLTAELQKAVFRFEERIQPDRVVVLGDIVHEVDAAATDRENAVTIRSILDEISCPVRYLPGNHDAVHLSIADDWPELFGHEAWGIDTDASLVYLDSTAPHLDGGRGEIGERQLRALRDALEDLSDALVFVHHPVHECDVSNNRWFADRPEEAFCADGAAVRNALAMTDAVAATFNGHLHEFGYACSGGISHFTVDAFNKQLTPNEAFGAYAIVDRKEDLRVRFVDGGGRENTWYRRL